VGRGRCGRWSRRSRDGSSSVRPGIRVLVLDRETFPRAKPCGGRPAGRLRTEHCWWAMPSGTRTRLPIRASTARFAARNLRSPIPVLATPTRSRVHEPEDERGANVSEPEGVGDRLAHIPVLATAARVGGVALRIRFCNGTGVCPGMAPSLQRQCLPHHGVPLPLRPEDQDVPSEKTGRLRGGGGAGGSVGCLKGAPMA
jgi:hypothetical protein